MAARTSIENIFLGEALADAARRFAELPAVITQQQVWSFRQIDNLSRRACAWLLDHGVGPGVRVGLACPNSVEFVLAYCAIVRSGATVVPLNFLYHEKELAWMLRDAEAKALFYSPLLRDKARAAEAEADIELAVEMAESDCRWQEMFRAAPAEESVVKDPNAVAVILYTSGTTGKPKGAMLTHRNLVSNAWSVARALNLRPGEDRILLVLPMFHAFGATAGMLHSLLHGCAFIPIARFQPAEVAEAIRRLKATVFLGVPAMYAAFLNLPEEHTRSLAQLRFCISGGAPLPQEIMQRFEDRFGVLIYEGDGPTECSPVTCVNPIGGRRKAGSVGVPVELVEMAIMDERGNRLLPNEIGEICVRGPNVMKGYWKRPEETAEAFFGEWFRTGDIGKQDEDGYFYILDRRKDMLIVNGMNVYPRMVEEVLHHHPAIHEAAVVGQPHPLHGEIPVAWIVPRSQQGVDAADLRRFCAQHLGRHEIPRRFYVVKELPRTPTGKVDKKALRNNAAT